MSKPPALCSPKIINYGLGAIAKSANFSYCSLNPCLGGIWSWSNGLGNQPQANSCLNPCLGGIWSWSSDMMVRNSNS